MEFSAGVSGLGTWELGLWRIMDWYLGLCSSALEESNNALGVFTFAWPGMAWVDIRKQFQA